MAMAEIEKVALDRDPQAFRTLFLTFGPKVKAMMLRQGADTDTAEEIAQETMFAVWRKAHLFVESKGSIATWIYTIARNLRIDRVRRQVVWHAYAEEMPDIAGSDEPPDDRLAREQAEVVILGALDTLPPEQREVIQLAFSGNLSHSEIARKLGLPLGTVKSRVRLAYQKLREALEGAL
jgi:RNA polymerase sigma-70 factor (ECF subfamily)